MMNSAFFYFISFLLIILSGISINYLIDVDSMYVYKSESGALMEGGVRGGRFRSKMYSVMDMSSYCRQWRIIRDTSIPAIIPEIGSGWPELRGNAYTIELETFFPLTWIQDDGEYWIKRWETIGSQNRAYNEIIRHLALAGLFLESPLWPYLKRLYYSEYDTIVDLLLACLMENVNFPFSEELMMRYTHDHVGTSSPFKNFNAPGKVRRYTWKHLDDPSNKAITNNCFAELERKLVKWTDTFDKLSRKKVHRLLKAQITYPGPRSRPANVTILDKSKDNTKFRIRADKMRGRKIGGVPIAGQETWKLYYTKKEGYKKLQNWARRLLGCDVSWAYVDGITSYYLALTKCGFAADIKTAEKQIGLLFPELGHAVDLGHPRFEARFAAEMYSGVGLTGALNFIFIVLYLKVCIDAGLMPKPNVVCIGGDNVTSDVPIYISIHMDATNEWLGFDVTKKVFGPLSLTTDGIDHRKDYHGGQITMTQMVQYVMKPLQSVVNNGLANMHDSGKYIKWCYDNKAKIYKVTDDNVINKSDLNKKVRKWWEVDYDAKEKFMDVFVDSLHWVEKVFVTQNTNPQLNTDQIVY